MEKEQEREWAQAQNIRVSVDLVEAAKNQLIFLAAVDRNRHLYESPALDWAIYRYNAFWLPLLAKHSESPVSDEPLVVPLDCEWIWHCHRLNPVRYKSDCEALFGKVLGNHNIISSVQATSKTRTEEIWNEMYPEEPYELDGSRPFTLDVLQKNSQSEKFTSYDLVSAVKRQAPFYYQVSRPHMSNDQFLQEAVARYKEFLHLIRTNRKNNIKRFCVPTYDIDLIWHSHQLSSVAYCNDLCELLGKVLEHDDTDSDRSKGKKLDTGFSETTKQFEDTFGLSYWKAGGMYRGNNPTPVTQIPFPFTFGGKKSDAPDNFNNLIQFPEMNSVEVLLEFVDIRNLHESHKGNLYVSFSKKQSDKLFNVKRRLSILSESGEKQVAYFQCEPSGEFIFEVVCQSPSNLPFPKSFKQLGSCSLSLQDCLVSGSQLSFNKWLPVMPTSGILATAPILLHVSVSFTPPTPALQSFHLVQSQMFKGSCFFSLPKIGKAKHAKNWACVIDDDGNDILRLKMRDLSKDMKGTNPVMLKEVHCIRDSGEMHTLAVLQGNEWLIKGTDGFLKLSRTSGTDGYLFELVGHKMVKLFTGSRLDYEIKECQKKMNEQDYITAVEFSAENPYGRAVALIDFKRGTLKVKDGWMMLTGITVAFILSDILRRENSFTAIGSVDTKLNQIYTSPSMPEAKEEVTNRDLENAKPDSGGCGDANCGSMSAKCGGGCGGGKCGTMSAKCGGCGGGGCGGGKCGSMSAKCSGGGCGGGKCGSMAAKCSGGGCGGGKCGSMSAKCSGGGCGGGKCGSMAAKCSGGGCGGGKCGSMSAKCSGGGCGGGKCGSMAAKCSGGGCGGGKCGSMAIKST